jgi:hypothetical protein
MFPVFITVCSIFYFSLLWNNRSATEYRCFLKRLANKPKRVRKMRQRKASPMENAAGVYRLKSGTNPP